MSSTNPSWRLIETERFEAEREAAFLHLMRFTGPKYAGEWLRGLVQTIKALPEFLGPRANPLDEQASRLSRAEVRRLVFAGPGRQRRGGVRYRIYYQVRDAEPGEIEGTLFILRIRHGAMEDAESVES